MFGLESNAVSGASNNPDIHTISRTPTSRLAVYHQHHRRSGIPPHQWRGPIPVRSAPRRYLHHLHTHAVTTIAILFSAYIDRRSLFSYVLRTAFPLTPPGRVYLEYTFVSSNKPAVALYDVSRSHVLLGHGLTNTSHDATVSLRFPAFPSVTTLSTSPCES